MSKFFGDMISEENMKAARNDLYPIRRSYYKLEKEVENATVGLQDLINAVKQAKEASLSDNPRGREYVEDIKKEFDKIAYLIEQFASEFQDNYEELSPIYIMEKLAGTFDDKDNFSMGVDCTTPIGSGKTGWNKQS